MQRFSKIKSKEEKEYKKDNILYKDNFLKIVKEEDWSILTGMDSVICIPYLIELNKFIIRQEYVPSFKYADGQEYHLNCVGGSVEQGESIEVAMIRELQEEAGIVLRDNYKIEFDKPLFMGKFTSIKVYPCIIPLNENDYHEIIPSGDGSKIEKMSSCAKIDVKYLNTLNCSDIITEFMIMKFKSYLNID